MIKGRQIQKTQLRQVIAGKLIESLDILALHRASLVELIEKEVEDNPFIEFDEKEVEIETKEKKDYLTEGMQEWRDNIEQYPEPPEGNKTLQEILLEDIGLIFPDRAHMELAREVVYSLDDRGWLRETSLEIAERLGINVGMVEEVVEKVKNLDPAGIAASGLRECLLIQLKRNKEENTLAFRILNDAYESFLSSDTEKLAKFFRLPEGDISDALKRIHELDPHPGRHLFGESQYVSPDAVIEKIPTNDGEEYIVYIPEHNIPRICLSSIYRKFLENPSKFNDKERDYLLEKFSRAKNFLEAIEQRKKTILRISRYLKEREYEFFLGKGSPVLFTEKEISEYAGVNVSTVSRAIKDKWIETPRGMFRFSYFFSHGRDKNYHWILSLLEDMVKREDKRKPLSDGAISKIFKGKGLNVARTTVVKYRKILGIPSSSKRKKP